MHEQSSNTLHLVSMLLQYPDEEMIDRLNEPALIADGSWTEEVRQIIQEFLNGFDRMTPIQAQELYTAVFDMDPSTTLNVTYHIHGDNEKRAAELAQLQHHYELAGWERISGELPDYLPMMLEFLSICENPEHSEPVWRCLQGMRPLIERLEKRAPAYAAILRPVARMAVDRYSPSEKREIPIEAKV